MHNSWNPQAWTAFGEYPCAPLPHRVEGGNTNGDSDRLESQQDNAEVKMEMKKVDDVSAQWVPTENTQDDTDFEDNSQQQMYTTQTETPVMTERLRPRDSITAAKVAQAFADFRTQWSDVKRPRRASREPTGRGPGRPWTHTSLRLVCLDVRLREKLGHIPNAQHISALTSLGLGTSPRARQRGICYFKNSESPAKFRETLEQHFPRLIPGQYCLGIASKGKRISEFPDGECLTAEEVKKRLHQGRLYIIPFALRDMEEVEYHKGFYPSGNEESGDYPHSAQESSTSPPQPPSPGSPDPLQDMSASPAPWRDPPTPWRSQEHAHPSSSGHRSAHSPGRWSAAHPPHGPVVPVAMHSAGHRVAASATQLECNSFADMVVKLRPSPPDNKKILLNINRHNFLQDARRGFFRPGVDLRRPTSVKFAGSSEVDYGGLSAQFRAELVQHLRDSCVFAGPENSKSLMYSYFCLEEEMYHHIGVMLAYVIAHGGPYPAFFSDKLFSLLLGEDVEFAVEDVQTPLFRHQLEQLQAAETPEETEAALKSLDSLLAMTGLNPHRMHRSQLTLCLADFLCNQMMRAPLKQLREGLSELGVWPLIQHKPDVGRPFLLAHSPSSFSIEALRDLWTCDIDGTTPAGREEIRIHGYFLDLLSDLDEDQGKRLLKFCMGLDTLPAGGLGHQPRLTFNHNDPVLTANTDTLELGLPVTPSMQAFNLAMMAALEPPPLSHALE